MKATLVEEGKHAPWRDWAEGRTMLQLDRVTIEDEAADGLAGARWVFCLVGWSLVLDEYQAWTKKTKRKKAVVSGVWLRRSCSESTLGDEEVPKGRDLERRAKAAWLDQLDGQVGVMYEASRVDGDQHFYEGWGRGPV